MQKNRIEVSGWLAAKPAVRYLPSGTPVASVHGRREHYPATNQFERCHVREIQ
jgi:primosomal replication protein N